MRVDDVMGRGSTEHTAENSRYWSIHGYNFTHGECPRKCDLAHTIAPHLCNHSGRCHHRNLLFEKPIEEMNNYAISPFERDERASIEHNAKHLGCPATPDLKQGIEEHVSFLYVFATRLHLCVDRAPLLFKLQCIQLLFDHLGNPRGNGLSFGSLLQPLRGGFRD
jgi:hypothetical protein